MPYKNHSKQFEIMKKTLVAFFLGIIWTSCEGVRESNGTVKDDLSGQPLDSVLVTSYWRKYNKDHYVSEVLTDLYGNWKASTKRQGCINGCPHLLVTFSKSGYKPKFIEDPNEGIEVRLSK